MCKFACNFAKPCTLLGGFGACSSDFFNVQFSAFWCIGGSGDMLPPRKLLKNILNLMYDFFKTQLLQKTFK